MSDISISAQTISSIALENQAAGAESTSETSNTVFSAANTDNVEGMDQSIVGAEVVSRSTDYMGAGTDLSSTGTDINVQNAVSSTLMSGLGSISDTIV